jgi:hypothetical protein
MNAPADGCRRGHPPGMPADPSRHGAPGGGVGYASAMNLNTDERDLLARAEEVTIETTSSSGVLHRTIIWIVVDGEDVFVRSVNGDGARWYREAVDHPDVGFEVGGTRIAARMVAAADPESVARCSAALRVKYASDPALRSMLRPHTLATTLRVLASA